VTVFIECTQGLKGDLSRWHLRLVVATEASSVARSLKLRHVDLG